MATAAEADFAALMEDRERGLVITPMLRTFLANAEFPEEFSIRFRKGDGRRASDGWFWPSTHPTLPPRLLWLYLNEPEALPVEYRQYMNTLALTMGSALHGFNEMCLEVMGVRTKELNTCTSCPPEKGCTEPGFVDPETGSRGHMDGVLDLDVLKPLPPQVPTVVGYEYKTGSERVVRALEDLDLDLYRAKHPKYYGQNQEYMRLSGLPMVIVVFQQLGWPWTFKEIHVPFDPVYAHSVATKYKAVRESAEMPQCCGSRGCDLADWCKVSRTPARKDQDVFVLPAPPRRTRRAAQ